MSDGLTLLPVSVPHDGVALWRCWMCGGDGAGALPREHYAGRCLGAWWGAVRRLGDLFAWVGIRLRTAAIWHAHRETAWRKAMAKP